MPPPPAQPFILTKIIATVGPACAAPQTLVRLIEEGARVFRINFSHGSFESFVTLLAAIREAGELAGQPVAALGDLSGPKIRVGKVVEGGVRLEPGDSVSFQHPAIVTAQPAAGEPIIFSTTLPRLIQDVQPGHRLLLDDGAVRLLTVDKTGDGEQQRLHCTVTVGGTITSSKGINAPDSDLHVPAMTEYDERCVDWALEHGIDLLALSFVRRADDLRRLRKRLKDARRDDVPIVAKIEKPQALDELDAIVDQADGLMVARGDLGVEMDLADVPVIQKRIIALAHDYGKPVIVATQMLQSMIDSPTPTRAEVSDVANAIFDGADAVMLSGETAVGKYPVQVVNMMKRIALAAQTHVGSDSPTWGRPPRRLQETRYRTAALAHGVSTVVRDLNARFIIVWSQRGGGARYLSQNRPVIPILAFSTDPAALRKMSPLFAVTPLRMEQPASIEDFVARADRLLLERGWAQVGDPVVVVAGSPIGTAGVTNTIEVHQVGMLPRPREEPPTVSG